MHPFVIALSTTSVSMCKYLRGKWERVSTPPPQSNFSRPGSIEGISVTKAPTAHASNPSATADRPLPRDHNRERPDLPETYKATKEELLEFYRQKIGRAQV